MKDEITEKTKLSLPLPLMFTAVAVVVGGAVWLTQLSLAVTPLAAQVERNTRQLELMFRRQYSFCLTINQIQKYTVPKEAQYNLECARLE